MGTEGGIIEHWSIESDQLMNTFDAHGSSDEGISYILELKTDSYLLWGHHQRTEGTSLIATSSLGCTDFRIWMMTLDGCNLTLTPHMRVETSFTPGTGIRYLLESTENQIVAVDTHKSLKFYEFIDKTLKEEREKQAAEEELLINGLKELFVKYDADQNGMLEFDEFCIMAQDFFSAFGVDQKDLKGLSSVEQEQKLREIFNVWDEDGSNYLTKAEMRPIVKKMMQQGFKFKAVSASR